MGQKIIQPIGQVPDFPICQSAPGEVWNLNVFNKLKYYLKWVSNRIIYL